VIGLGGCGGRGLEVELFVRGDEEEVEAVAGPAGADLGTVGGDGIAEGVACDEDGLGLRPEGGGRVGREGDVVSGFDGGEGGCGGGLGQGLGGGHYSQGGKKEGKTQGVELDVKRGWHAIHLLIESSSEELPGHPWRCEREKEREGIFERNISLFFAEGG